MKKRLLKALTSGFTYGAMVGMFLFLVNTPPDSVLPQTLKILLVAAICGVVAGIFFTALLLILDAIHAKTFDPYRKELASEGEILLEDSAKRLTADRLVRGWLFLTKESLSFYHAKGESRRLAVSEIDTVQITDPKRNQVTVTASSGESEVFVVSDALAWFHTIGDLQND